MGTTDGFVADIDVLREYGSYCNAIAGGVRDVAVRIDARGAIPAAAWDGGGMTTLLTLQDNLDTMRDSYQKCLRAFTARTERIAWVLLDAHTGLDQVATGYEETDDQTRAELPR